MQLLTYFRHHDHFLNYVNPTECTYEQAPESLLASLGVASTEIYYERQPIGTKPFKWSVRLYGHGPSQQFRDLKAFQIGRFITVRGNVVRVSSVRPHPIQLSFRCLKCQQSLVLSIKDGLYRTPSKCPTTHCMSKNFVAERESPMTKCINLQKIKIQEMSTLDTVDEEGRVPRVIDIELSNDLVDTVVPGEVITVSGILKAGDPTDKSGPASLYIDAVSIQKIKSMDATLGVPVKAIDVPDQRLQEIMSIANSKTILQTLVRSFCPHIYGNELVKMGLLLGLFGGSRRSSQIDVSALSVRSDPHILVVGDPGLGKSQLLTFASLVAPRAVYVCANTSTAVGLTAAVQDGSLEAGALVLADQGCCCIDEFDKIVGDSWRSLLDVMEQQTVNVAKAGIVCTLPARTSILAAANPVGGHYSKEKSVVDNLKMDSALLSRFDLIFVLLDKPNADMDKVLSEHVLGSVKSEKGQLRTAAILLTQVTQAPTTLRELLDPKHPIATIGESLLRHYISYARQKITPRMTEEAATILQEFYLEMRKNHVPDETLPVTTRHLESMIRLSEARAKMELRNFVSAQDAHQVIELVKFCTADTVQTVFGSKSRKGSKTGGMKKFISELIKISSRTGDTEFTTQQLQALFDALKVTELPFGELLDSLNENGYLLKKSTGYRLLVT